MAEKSIDAGRKSKISTVSPEIGTMGVAVDMVSITRESVRDLQFPCSLDTFDTMSRNSVIAATLAAINTIASQVEFKIDSFDETTTHKQRRDFLHQCLFKDMEYPFNHTVRDALTMSKYGFSVLEKVYRFRRRKDGSLYNDGRIGIKYLPIRAQQSIKQFVFDDNNRTLKYVEQYPVGMKGSALKVTPIKLPKDRILLFRVNPTGLSPFGHCPLADAYKPWRVLERLQDIETTSANRNLNGIPHLTAPSEILEEDPEDVDSIKRVRKIKAGLSALASGEQTYIATPSDRYDATEGGAAQYEFKLVTGSSSHLTALNSIITRYSNETFQTMCADVLTLDNGQGGGSTSLTSNKQTMLNMFVEARIKEFLEVLNKDLIPDLWRRNGWDDTKCPTIKHGRIEKVSLEVLAKAVQQLMATNSIPITVENINYLMEVFGFPTRIPAGTSREELKEILGFEDEMQSRSADGMKRGTTGNGTAKKVPAKDANAANRSKDN